jgi:hypothetical protein
MYVALTSLVTGENDIRRVRGGSRGLREGGIVLAMRGPG